MGTLGDDKPSLACHLGLLPDLGDPLESPGSELELLPPSPPVVMGKREFPQDHLPDSGDSAKSLGPDIASLPSRAAASISPLFDVTPMLFGPPPPSPITQDCNQNLPKTLLLSHQPGPLALMPAALPSSGAPVTILPMVVGGGVTPPFPNPQGSSPRGNNTGK